MNYFDKNKILTISVVLLLFINLGILGLLWFDRSQKKAPPGKMPPGERMQHPGGMPPDGGPKEFIINELNLNEKQKQEYGKLVEEHRSEMKIIKEKIREEKDELWNSFSQSEIANPDSIASKIGEEQKQIELVTYRHFQKVKELCDTEQKKKFDEVIKEALRMMGPNNPPPPPH